MTTTVMTDNKALTGAPISTFLRYFIPSFFGLLALSSAAIVDGIFVGNYVGSDALAAITLLTPFLSLMIGVTIMLSVGGSVRVGKAMGEQNLESASASFSKIIVSAMVLALITIVVGYCFETQLFNLLGANAELIPLMSEYFRVFLPFLLPQLLTIALYFFVRIDDMPNLAAASLVCGSLTNIVLDYVFIAHFNWGLSGAAAATAISQIIQATILSYYFFAPNSQLKFSIKQKNWFEVFQAAFNGVSEFINEVSGAVIAFLLNWLLITSLGTDGVAAIAVIEYSLLLGLMIFYAIGDANQVLLSQNFGAKAKKRLQKFMLIGAVISVIFSIIFITLMAGFNETITAIFLDEEAQTAAQYAHQFAMILWPIFLFNGINVLVSSYLTALHLPTQSAIIATLRGLILPASLLGLFYYYIPQIHFLWALPIAELLTFFIAVKFYLDYRPSQLIR